MRDTQEVSIQMNTDFYIHPIKNDSDIHAVADLAEEIETVSSFV